MKRLTTITSLEGFHMPAEYEPHKGCVMIWPVRPGSWPYGAKEAQSAFSEVARTIAKSEKVWMLAGKKNIADVRAHFADNVNIEVWEIETNDAWARDIGPTCVINEKGVVRGIDWQFNAWGGVVDGLYSDWQEDNEAAGKICDALSIDCYDARHFVLEGGSIHSDGQGTLLATEACLLSKGRNPRMSKIEIENELKKYLGAEKILWIPRGIYRDETNEHVDNICAFVRPGEVVLAWTDNKNDPQYELSLACLKTLERETDAKGRKLVIHKLPIPRHPICLTKKEVDGFVFEKGEEIRTVHERLAASYVNFYLSNQGVLVPQFGDENDFQAVKILSKLFPEREIYPIPARAILVGGGNIHCITQQIPNF